MSENQRPQKEIQVYTPTIQFDDLLISLGRTWTRTASAIGASSIVSKDFTEEKNSFFSRTLSDDQ